MADDASSAVVTLASLAQKLSHELLEVRERALHSLAFKLDNSLLRAADVGSSEAALRALLEWFNFEETGAREVEVLAMLRRVAKEDPTSVERLLKLGADRFLRDLCSNRCVEVSLDSVGITRGDWRGGAGTHLSSSSTHHPKNSQISNNTKTPRESGTDKYI